MNVNPPIHVKGCYSWFGFGYFRTLDDDFGVNAGQLVAESVNKRRSES